MGSLRNRCLLVVAVAGFACSTLQAAACADLAALKLPGTTVTSATTVNEVCRVALVLKPSKDSDINTEVWLPVAHWNGKFRGLGNGGFAGYIDVKGLENAVANGYAAASTDTGHKEGGTDAAWALRHPEKTIDFGYRAIHETAVTAKTLIRAFYGEAPKHCFFSSCSNGGRQALMEAQRFPEDYDGIVAGAPANYWTHLLTTAIFNAQALSAAGSALTPAQLPAITEAALAACDAPDGVIDGVIENPAGCHFDTNVLLCKGKETQACLTAPQVTALQKLYGGSKTLKGRSVFPGFAPGGEADVNGWAEWITGSAGQPSLLYQFGTNFFKYMVYSDAAWDFKTSRIEQNVRLADQKLSSTLNATNPDLTSFRSRGGKLILFHGWSDAAIPPQNTIDYYKTVAAKMSAQNAATFVRLFMAPGCGHCGGGAGPDVFEHEMDAAAERWVEQGVAPERIVATKMKPGSNPPVAMRTRPLCAYPLTAHWNGSGSTDDAASFSCR